jgi:TolB-like protein/cytochrome c-type biogenesis protein CcmH/NrfG
LADVFISYARADQAAAARLAKGLQVAGFDVWWDADLPAHRAYSEVIERNLEQAKAVVVLWSKAAAASQWVRAEADFARNAGKLVQAAVDGTMPPMPFNQIQCADLKGWRGSAKHGGWSKLQGSVAALVSGEAAPGRASARLPWRDRLQANRWLLAAAFAVVLAAFALVLYVERPRSDAKPVVAVLPFDSLNPQDASLAAGMWEDTRQAIGRNPQLLVLGPNTSEELAKKDSGATRKAADYLLNASIRTVGDRIRVSTDLTRTSDGAQVWSDTFDRKLDDVFKLQSDIAQQIEGHIRGRLATGGGQLPQNIATSGEVYALYSDARAKIRSRDDTQYAAAVLQLQQVVQKDPNFAPGWATLAVIKQFGVPVGNSTTTAEQDARRAVALAPNLGAAHAALGFALGPGPAARAELRRALALDPNDIEAMNWLASSLDNSQTAERLALYSKITELEPMWWPAIFNKLDLLYRTGKLPAMEQELARVEKLGDTRLANLIRLDILSRKGDLSAVVDRGVAAYELDRSDRELMYLWQALVQLGFFDLADRLSPPPNDYIPFIRANDPRAMEIIEQNMPAKALWRNGPLPIVIGRVCLLTGRMPWLAKMYHSAVKSPEEFDQLVGGDRMPDVVPGVAIALRQGGDRAEAEELLRRAEAHVRTIDADDPDGQITVARIYAAQGRTADAVKLLAAAVRGGWLPKYLPIDIDLEHDPALRELHDDPQFQQIRRHILATIARERSEVNLAALRQLAASGR